MAQAPNELDAIDALAAIAAGRLSAEALTRACLERIAARDARRARVRPSRSGARARRSPRARPRAGVTRGPLHGLPFGVKDIIDTHDMPTRVRLADSCRPPAGGGRGVRGAGARGRRRDARQDGDDGIRVAPSGADGEPAQSRAHAGRIVERIGRRGRRFHGAGGVRHADRRVDHPPRVLLRRGRLQAFVRHDQSDGREAARRKLRHRRAVRALRRRLRARRRRARGRRCKRCSARGRAACARRALADAGVAPRRRRERPCRRNGRAAARARTALPSRRSTLPADFELFLDAQSDVLRFEAARVFAFERTRRADLLVAGQPRRAGGRRGDLAAALSGSAGVACALSRAVRERDRAVRSCFLSASAPGEAPAGLGDTGEATFNRWGSGLRVPCLNLPGFNGGERLARRHSAHRRDRRRSAAAALREVDRRADRRELETFGTCRAFGGFAALRALAGAGGRGQRRRSGGRRHRRHVLLRPHAPVRQIALPSAFQDDALIAVHGAKQRQQAIGRAGARCASAVRRSKGTISSIRVTIWP